MDFWGPNKPDYDERVLSYAKKHKISGLCDLNLNTKHWAVVELPEAKATGQVDPNFVDFKQSAWPGVIFNARGLSQAEPWGTWSEGSAVSLEFAAPLPEKFAVHLVAHAFAADVGKEFVARVGNSTAKFTLGDFAEERVLEFSNPTRSKTIEIEIPAPASPKSLGYNGDDRSLGIGLKELRIVPPPAQGVDPNFVDFNNRRGPASFSTPEAFRKLNLGGRGPKAALFLSICRASSREFAVHLVAHAFAADVRKDFVARVGIARPNVTLGNSAEERVLQFSNPTRSKTIEIENSGAGLAKIPGLQW